MIGKHFWTSRAIVTLGFSVALVVSSAVLASARETQEFHRTYSLTPNGQLSLENVNGDVHITAWDQNEVKIDAIKTVWSGTALSDVRIEVQSSPDSISIQSKTPHHWLGSSHWKVDYSIMAPRGARLEKVDLVNGTIAIEGMKGYVNASSVNGHIQTRDVSGQVSLSTVNGAIDAGFESARMSQPVSLGTVNGGISITLPPDVNAHLNAHTLNGGISCDFPIRTSVDFVGRTLDGDLGRGGGDIRLKTVNGHIAVHRASAEAN
jgi:hypothetical protein